METQRLVKERGRRVVTRIADARDREALRAALHEGVAELGVSRSWSLEPVSAPWRQATTRRTSSSPPTSTSPESRTRLP